MSFLNLLIGFFILLTPLECNKEQKKSRNELMQSKQIQIKLDNQTNQLKVSFFNTFSEEISIWSLSNFLGWETLSFDIKAISSKNIKTIKRKIRDWTGSEEMILKIPSGASRDFKFNFKDGWWNIDESIDELLEESIMIRAVYNSPLSKEAEENNVFTGTLESNWIESKPPHKWLFSDHQLQLKLDIESGLLNVSLLNISSSDIRLWDFNNNWGWETLSFRLKDEEKEYKIERVMRHLKELPKINKLSSGEKFVFDVNLQDELWQLKDLPQNLKNVPIQIQAILAVPVYPETEEYQAFFGSLKSKWISSQPSHEWLFSKD